MNSIVIAKFGRHHNESGLQINGLNQNVSRSVCKATVHGRVVFLGCPRSQPQDIATVATFLASTDSGWITGETFRGSGGYR
jgi:NAD(P)-dependent dehydrogenase (short-subunit alcohol dehydrogenase family)